MNTVAIPPIGLGTWLMRGSACTQSVRTALELGYRHIDTAEYYKNEADIGEALTGSSVPREELFLTTKVFNYNMEPRKVIASAEDSLRNLQTDYIDLLLIHWPTPEVPLEKSLESFVKLQESGKIKHIGVSNFPVALLKKIAKIGVPILANQVEYHPFLSQNAVLEYCQANGIFLTAYAPLAEGKAAQHPVLQTIGRKHNKSAAQVALRWLTAQPGVVAIPKASSAANAKANLEIFDFDLDAEDNAAIAALPKNQRGFTPPFAPEWDLT